jgi:cellulose synthase/poly-beta-1,6-N-acetylglucosamine synthase-like glycosyltransferase
MLGALTVVLGAVTGYVYVGYPVAVELLSRRAAPEGPYDRDALPTVSVVVAAYNERGSIAAKVANLLALDYPPDLLDLVVVADGSDDGTEVEAAAAGAGRVLVLHTPERQGKARAMARGVAASTGSVVVFMDANNVVEPGALREIVLPLSDPRVGAVTGSKAVDGGAEALTGGERAYWRYESAIKKAESRLGCCTGVIGELFAIRRELVPDFPPDLVNDDFFMAMQVARAGRKVAYAPAATSWEPTAPSAADDAVRRRRMSAGRWQSLARWQDTVPLERPMVVWQVASHKYLRLVLPFTMAGALAANAADVATGIGRPGQGLTRTALAAQLAFYGLAAVGPAAPGPRPVRKAAAAARYLVRSNLASAEGLVQYLQQRDSLHLWERVDRLPVPDPSVPDPTAAAPQAPSAALTEENA